MNKYKLAFGLISVFTISIIVFNVRKNKLEKRLVSISDAGYETAYDVLYPLKAKRFSKRFR